MSNSEVRRLMEQIDLQTQAIERAMHGTAIVASHESINARYTNLGRVQEELALHIGEQSAVEVLLESYVRNVG